LTIELRGDIPEELRPAVGDRLFGCDACQEACPFNRRSPCSTEPALRPREGMNPVDLAAISELDEEGFRQHYRRTPLWRANHEGVLRNAGVVRGNQQHGQMNPD
jgi:epoxyqueuosine reductase